MSLASSDFGDDDAFGDALMDGADAEQGLVPESQIAPPPAYQKQGFNIYSVMLILSFVFLTIAAIMYFIDAGKY